MADDFEGHESGLESPVRFNEDVTPNDGADLPNVPRALWVGTQGDVRVTVAGDGTVADGGTATYRGVQGWLQVHAKRVHATGTTASDIVAAW